MDNTINLINKLDEIRSTLSQDALSKIEAQEAKISEAFDAILEGATCEAWQTECTILEEMIAELI